MANGNEPPPPKIILAKKKQKPEVSGELKLECHKCKRGPLKLKGTPGAVQNHAYVTILYLFTKNCNLVMVKI